MSDTSGVGNGQLLAVILGLALFGIAYNALVAWMERHHYTEGFLSLIVALGVMGTMQLEALAFSPRRMTENEKLLKVTTALASVQKALRFLENAGAQTRPQQRKES